VSPIGQLTSHMDPREAFVGPSTQTKRKPTPRYHISSFSTQKCTANGSMIRHRHAVRTDTHSLAHSTTQPLNQTPPTCLLKHLSTRRSPTAPTLTPHRYMPSVHQQTTAPNPSLHAILPTKSAQPPPPPGPQVHLSNSKF